MTLYIYICRCSLTRKILLNFIKFRQIKVFELLSSVLTGLDKLPIVNRGVLGLDMDCRPGEGSGPVFWVEMGPAWPK